MREKYSIFLFHWSALSTSVCEEAGFVSLAKQQKGKPTFSFGSGAQGWFIAAVFALIVFRKAVRVRSSIWKNGCLET